MACFSVNETCRKQSSYVPSAASLYVLNTTWPLDLTDHNLTCTLRYKRALLVSTAVSAPLARWFWRIIVKGKLARLIVLGVKL
ncbi:hypothetical protein HZ326_28330 [Fusarium oxysporum f. sp. albedinis]|nr:hypothetical protein HZ326_28330 [Fusarium oxysporum f. sp. albedinis]